MSPGKRSTTVAGASRADVSPWSAHLLQRWRRSLAQIPRSRPTTRDSSWRGGTSGCSGWTQLPPGRWPKTKGKSPFTGCQLLGWWANTLLTDTHVPYADVQTTKDCTATFTSGPTSVGNRNTGFVLREKQIFWLGLNNVTWVPSTGFTGYVRDLFISRSVQGQHLVYVFGQKVPSYFFYYILAIRYFDVAWTTGIYFKNKAKTCRRTLGKNPQVSKVANSRRRQDHVRKKNNPWVLLNTGFYILNQWQIKGSSFLFFSCFPPVWLPFFSACEN